MGKSYQGWGCRFILAACAISGIINLSANRALAQVTPDDTLGTQVNNFVITGGRLVNTNLFHSFSSFSVPAEQTALFNNAASIVNIFGRVTGSSVSDIQGTIKAQGTANLFLMNPSGIIFGPNSRLDIGGSFVGTTANAIKFPGGGEFSLTSTVEPGNTLLSVNPSALFVNQTPAGAIVNQSRAKDPNDPSITDGLKVREGRSLLLVGGDVRLDGGIIKASGGRVDLGGLAAPGEVEIIGKNNLGLRFPDGVAKADISLTNKAQITASITSGGGEEAGIVILRGNNVSLDNSLIFSQILEGGQGNPGGILIEAGSLSLTNNAGIASSSFGSGKAGDILIEVDGPVSLVNSIGIQSNVENGATNSNGGLVSIKAGSLSLLGGSQVQTLVRGNEDGEPPGQGNAGTIEIDVRDTVTISGKNSEDKPSAIFSTINPGVTGNGGTIEISARSIALSDSGKINTDLFGTGTPGSIYLEATDSISLTNGAKIQSVIREGAVATSGDNPFSDEVDDSFEDQTTGGTTGTILISTGGLSINNNSFIDASTEGQGDAGSIIVAAEGKVSLTNGGAIFSRVEPTGTGNSGGIYMAVESLTIEGKGTEDNRSALTTSALGVGQGNPGIIWVLADKDITIKSGADDDVPIQDNERSGIYSRVGEETVNSDTNDSGILLSAESIFLKDGAIVTVDNDGTGEAGDIVILTRDLILNNQAKVTAASALGTGGEIFIAGELIVNNQGQDTDGTPVLLPGDFVLLLRNSEISTEAGSRDRPGGINGGDITIFTRYLITAPARSNDLDAEAFDGPGGRIEITADRFYDIDERPLSILSNDISASSGFGEDGIVTSNVLNADPTQGIGSLPVDPVDPSTLISEACAPPGGTAERPNNQFIVTGRGGLPPDPNAAFPGEAGVNDLGTPNPGAENTTGSPNSTNPTSPTPVATASPQKPEIVEAQGWVYGENGDIIFTANAPNITPTNPVLTPASTCNVSSKLPQ